MNNNSNTSRGSKATEPTAFQLGAVPNPRSSSRAALRKRNITQDEKTTAIVPA